MQESQKYGNASSYFLEISPLDDFNDPEHMPMLCTRPLEKKEAICKEMALQVPQL